MVELVIKYYGDVGAAVAPLGAKVEILSESFGILSIDEDKLPLLNNITQIEYIEWPKDISLNMTESLYHACISQATAAYGLKGSGVIIAAIDSGVDYTHPDFCNSDKTSRIICIWDMTAQGTPPAGFTHGHLYSQKELNAALATPKPLEIIPQIDTIGHGTAVLGVAAGNGAFSNGLQVGVAPLADIIAVKLGKSSRTIDLMRGLKFVADTARARSAPCAINISYGTNEGLHDDKSLFEQYVDEIAQLPKISIAVAAGNEASAGHHFSGNIATGQSENIGFTVAEGLSKLYLVLWKNFADIFTVEVISPQGKSSGIMHTGDSKKVISLGDAQLFIDMGQPTHYNPHQEIFIQVTGQVPAGRWSMVLTSLASVEGDFNIWLPTTEEVGTNTAFATPKPNATITMPATSENVIAVGAYDATIDSYAEFSGRGFGGQKPTKPDIVAPGVNVLSTAAGGGYDAYSGTSIAAPFVAGCAALLMEWGIVKGNDADLYGQRLRAFLHLGASRDEYGEYPNELWGYGKLCLSRTLDYLKDMKSYAK